ncbi:MAG: phospho-sugar mutase [Candidatus Melainabacteria bacterium]|nr:phospho-sugar mutase [Candidatus Melainabacteria bacterium]
MTIPQEIQRRVDYWLNGPFDEKTKEAVRTLQKDPQGLIDAFFTDLSFGTGGMRGIMGPGTARMNIYTIRLATQGLANYLRKQNQGNLSVVIGYDSRNHSQEFAKAAARVLAGNGIHVYLLAESRPTPYISFVCRLKKASAAINITASHNPKEYNGYKVYWSDGAQIVHPHDEGIVKEVDALKDLSAVHLSTPNDPLIEITALDTLDKEYIKAIAPLQNFPEENKKNGKSLKIVYSPLHGTGLTIVPAALNSWGFTSIDYVEEQKTPNGDFPSVKFPNPEYKETLELGIEKLKRTQADLFIATDPDADRIGTVILHDGKEVLFNGNEMAAICVDYLCEVLKMPPKGAFVTTIVTTELLKKIAEVNHTRCFEVLTGFKYIGEKIHLWETSKDGYAFIFGAEESYGYLLGTHARDKDAIISSCLIAEIALYAKLRGQTLLDRLDQIYKKYGVFREEQLSLNFKPGKEGMEQMGQLMQRLRTSPPKEIVGKEVVSIEDYEKGERFFLDSPKKEKLDLPQSDVLLFRLSDKSRLVIRPSGTEPKVKIYGCVTTDSFPTIAEGIKECDQRLAMLLQALKKEAG